MQIIEYIIVFILAGWAFLNYIHIVKRDEILFFPNPTDKRKLYEYELFIKFTQGHDQTIYFYSDNPKHHIDSIHHYFYHRSKKAYVFGMRDATITLVIPKSDISYLELRSKQRKYIARVN